VTLKKEGNKNSNLDLVFLFCTIIQIIFERSVEATPKHLIIVDGAIMQAIPEHPKRDFIFCLSTAFGDAYLFQVSQFQKLFSKIDNYCFL